MSAQPLPATPALPEHATDATGVITGNADLAGSSQWAPPQGPPERAPLPGHEHELDPGAKVWPWLTEACTFNLCWIIGAVGIALGAARWIA